VIAFDRWLYGVFGLSEWPLAVMGGLIVLFVLLWISAVAVLLRTK